MTQMQIDFAIVFLGVFVKALASVFMLCALVYFAYPYFTKTKKYE